MCDAQRYCPVGCTHPGSHKPDCPHPATCPGCQPRTATHHLLCTQCVTRLDNWLAPPKNPESLLAINAWLASNQGQHPRTPTTLHRNTSNRPHNDHATAVITCRQAIETVIRELADDFTTTHHLTKHPTPTLEAVITRLRPYQPMLHRWPPITDHIPHITDLVNTAHGLAPWRDPTAPHRTLTQALEQLAALPPLTAREATQLLGLEPRWLYRAGCPIRPVTTHTPTPQNPARYSALDIYRHLTGDTPE